MPFRDITGHRRLLELMVAAAVRGSLPPSLIFAGPDGVGKRMAAVALAQLLNCLSRDMFGASRPEEDLFGASRVGRDQDLFGASRVGCDQDMFGASRLGRDAPGKDACGTCASCRRIARGVHADVLVIEPGETGSIKVDQIRDAVERSAYRPFEGRRRVVIVDDAHEVLPDAQNALLKTLEEPPSASMFVLVTSCPDLLLDTVRSRCQRLRFGRLAPADIAGVLVRNHGFAPSDAHAAAAASDGSVGRAVEGGAEDFVDARDAAAGMLQGIVSTRDPRRRLEGAKTLTGAARGVSDRDELARRLRALSSILRDLGVLLSRADERCLANADLEPVLQRLAGAFDGARTIRAFSAVDLALSALDRNASPKIVADWLAFQI